MLPALSKPADELTPHDIQELVSRDVQEGENVEFKRGLSSSGTSGGSPGSTKITDGDKKSLVKEIVAFANSYGGRLFLGIEESNDEPPTAQAIIPIPDCTDLAERLSRSCADSIDPPMLRLNVVGIPTQLNGSGVIVFDVPQSTQAPHMSNRDHRAYRRRGSESVPMDMRDIQDMTLRSANRYDRIEKEFSKRKKEFDEKAKEFEANHNIGYCYRLSFIPLSEVDIDQVHGNTAIIPENKRLQARLSSIADQPFAIVVPSRFNYLPARPIVRGTALTDVESVRDVGYATQEFTLWSNGGLEMWIAEKDIMYDRLRLHPEWLLNPIANGLGNVERVRRYVDSPTLEYGLEVELRIVGKTLAIHNFKEEDTSSGYQTIDIGKHIYPRYPVGAVNTFDDVASLIIKDWFNNAGYDWHNRVVIDYQLGSA